MPSEAPLRIIQLTPGAGKMFCGACLRDNTLVNALRAQGHSVVMAPMYLPLTLEEADPTEGTRIFFGGINVYLEQQSAFFRTSPTWFHRMLSAPALLDLAAGFAGKTRAEELGPLTISMLRGEDGNQARELDDLIPWLKSEKPDVICLSNSLLSGLVRRIKAEVRAPVICSLQGEDYFLDALPMEDRATAWQVAAEKAADLDFLIAPSQYYANLMSARLKVSEARMRVVYNGINLEGYDAPAPANSGPPVLGFFARMCRDKGIDLLVNAFIRLKKRPGLENVKLRVGGSCGPMDQIVVEELREMLKANQMLDDAEFCPNLTRAQKLDFLRSLTVFSEPARQPEAFGLPVIEAMAAGVPVVQPDQGAFPELVKRTGGGQLYRTGDMEALIDTLEIFLRAPNQARTMGAAGQTAVRHRFNSTLMAAEFAKVCAEAARNFRS